VQGKYFFGIVLGFIHLCVFHDTWSPNVLLFQKGLGQAELPAMIASPHLRGHVTNPSKKLEQSLNKGQRASNGCKTIQNPAQNAETGQAIKKRRTIQIKL